MKDRNMFQVGYYVGMQLLWWWQGYNWKKRAALQRKTGWISSTACRAATDHTVQACVWGEQILQQTWLCGKHIISECAFWWGHFETAPSTSTASTPAAPCSITPQAEQSPHMCTGGRVSEQDFSYSTRNKTWLWCGSEGTGSSLRWALWSVWYLTKQYFYAYRYICVCVYIHIHKYEIWLVWRKLQQVCRSTTSLQEQLSI